MNPIPVIDLFAGPGGLNEGFSRLGEDIGAPAFRTIGSFEMESSACSTLRLRGAYRFLLRNGGVPEDYYRFIRGEIDYDEFRVRPRISEALEVSSQEVHEIELGLDREESDQLIRDALNENGLGDRESLWALIGGPPCQAYSLAGRSRRTNDVEFANDKKHFLYREYLHIIAEFAPPIFVMENVKGLLSSTHSGEGMFARIRKDLENPGTGLEYEIHSLTVDREPEQLEPADYIIRSELYGVPQRRHRVILLGIRTGFKSDSAKVGKLTRGDAVSVGDAIGPLPALRSGISPVRQDTPEAWANLRETVESTYGNGSGSAMRGRVPLTKGGRFLSKVIAPSIDERYSSWISDPALQGVVQHEARYHMAEDLKRYWYAAHTASCTGVSPKLREFPDSLLPNHKNARVASVPFGDRFRVQLRDAPATTVVSHIAKDGHYYIHPDPSQMRSLTVREAARLQSFPDNYFFMGSRTQQYHQVGNAVPPLLANQIAQVVSDLFNDVQLYEMAFETLVRR